MQSSALRPPQKAPSSFKEPAALALKRSAQRPSRAASSRGSAAQHERRDAEFGGCVTGSEIACADAMRVVPIPGRVRLASHCAVRTAYIGEGTLVYYRLFDCVELPIVLLTSPPL